MAWLRTVPYSSRQQKRGSLPFPSVPFPFTTKRSFSPKTRGTDPRAVRFTLYGSVVTVCACLVIPEQAEEDDFEDELNSSFIRDCRGIAERTALSVVPVRSTYVPNVHELSERASESQKTRTNE